MNKSVIGVVVGLVAVGGIVAAVAMTNKDEPLPASTQTQTETESASTTNSSGDAAGADDSVDTSQSSNVTIQSFAFGPNNISVKVGTAVTWTNQDSSQHDITPDSESDDFKASELLSQGESYSYTFTKAGTYGYFCSLHPEMKATVTVTE